MRGRTYLVVVFAIGVIMGQSVVFPQVDQFWNSSQTQFEEGSSDGLFSPSPGMERVPNGFSTSASTVEGTLNPTEVEQSGYTSTGNLSARTDTWENVRANLTIDEANGWVGSQADIDVWNLERLYVVNGSFDEGIAGQNINPNDTVPATKYPYGWSALSNTTDIEQLQIAAYDNSGGKYVVVENQGKKKGASGKQYDHIAGTQILWYQTVDNSPYTEEFVLNFNYFYLRGPLYKPGGDPLTGNCTISVFVNGSVVWNVSLPTLNERGVWYDTGDISINITGIESSFQFMIGLVIDETMELNADSDYDNDTFGDGIANTVYVTAYIDDVSFTGSSPPEFADVAFNFTAGIDTVAVTGSSGTGSASITKSDFWTTDPLSTELTSNVSVGFDYRTNLISHRFSNSSWINDISKEGVAYSVSVGENPDLDLYTYIGTLGDYENFSVTIRYPSDWENVTVYNPFLSDVTGQCTTSSGWTYVPESVLDVLGWWRITLQSPNYAKSISSQIYDPGIGQWSDSSIFRPTNKTQVAVSLGTAFDTPTLVDPVNITWSLPNGTEWSSDSIIGGSNGNINSTERALGPTNTSAGLWTVTVHWNNDSEVAYGSNEFGVYHTATLVPVNSMIETDTGLTVSNFLTYTDADTGEYLMDENATMVANWSETIVEFGPNLVKNWWEADFNTSLVGGGEFIVVVNVSRLYFDNVSCQFIIVSTHPTSIDLPEAGGSPVYVEINQTYTVDFLYQLINGTGVDNALLSAQSTPSSGLSFVTGTGTGSGNYTVDITALESGTYTVAISASKDYHHEQQESFTLVVQEIDTSLESLNGTADTTQYRDGYLLVVRYTNSTGGVLVGAMVQAVEVTPASGLDIGEVQDEGSGYYSMLFTPSNTTTFTILLRANLTNHATQFATFTLTVTEIRTTLQSNVSIASIGYSEALPLQVTFQDDDENGILGANITATVDPSGGLSFTSVADLGDGNYTLTINPVSYGTYQIIVQATKDNYQSAYHFISLVVSSTGTKLTMWNATTQTIQFHDTYRLVVFFQNSTGHGLSGAIIDLINVFPNYNLTIAPTQDQGDGNYSIVLTPDAAVTFTMTIRASLANHVTQQNVTFTLTVNEIPTSTSLEYTSASISADQNYTIRLFFGEEGLTVGIEGAIISVLDPEEYPLLFSNVTEEGEGWYNLTVTPSSIGSFSFSIRASKPNYRVSATSFTLTVTQIETVIEFDDEDSSASVSFSQSFDIYFFYNRTDLDVGVASANISVTAIPSDGFQCNTTDLGNGYYVVKVWTSSTGRWTIKITASKEDHLPAEGTFSLDVMSIVTTLNLLTPLYQQVYGLPQLLIYEFLMSDGTGVTGANIDIAGTGASWVQVNESALGNYTITITPLDIGENFKIYLTFRKNGFISENTSLQFSVDPAPLRVEVSSLAGMEGERIEFVIQLFNANSNQTVSGADVTCRFNSNQDRWFDPIPMNEIGDGRYAAILTLPIPNEGEYLSLQLTVEKENHALESEDFVLAPGPNIGLRLLPYVSTGLVGVFALVGIVAGRIVYARRRRQQVLETLVIKRRFDSIQSLIGVVVLHRMSGLPIYSKMLKGGFDESMISAFITAISQFRSEFELESQPKTFSIIPVSDIISTVTTNNLVCSFITVSKPTEHQESRMIAFARTISLVFDDIFETTPTSIIEVEQVKMFNQIFDDTMDGGLARRHRVVVRDVFPKSLRCVQWSAPKVEADGEFGLAELADSMADCGIEEGQAYTKIIDAIQRGLIEPTMLDDDVSLPLLWDIGDKDDENTDPD